MNIHTDQILVSGNLQLYSHPTPSTLIQRTNIQQKFIQHVVNAKYIFNSTPDSIVQIWNVLLNLSVGQNFKAQFNSHLLQ